VLSILITTLLIVGVDVVSIIAVFSIAGNVISLMLYGKMQKVETNTNGAMTAQQALITDLVEFVKHAPAQEK
jgi:hypothetical protein